MRGEISRADFWRLTPGFDQKVNDRVENRWASHEAKKLFESEIAEEEFEVPERKFWTLEEQLAAPEVPQAFLIDGLMIEGGNMLLAAAKKSGKSTLMMNLMKSLCDGTPFLDKFDVKAPEGRVAWWDYELDQNYATNQLRKIGIKNPGRASVEHLRGYSTPFIAPAVQEWAIKWLKEREVKVWIIDPFGAVFTGEENSNDDVREWHKAVDSIKRRAGVSEVILVTHTGHADVEEGHERTRGASRLGDWADNLWTWSGSTQKNEDAGLPKTQRWLITQASRGVEDQKWTVDCDVSTWALSVVGVGGRASATKSRIDAAILAFVQANPECSTNKIKEGVKGRAEDITTYLDSLVASGAVLRTVKGNGKAHRIPDLVQPVPSVPTGSDSDGPGPDTTGSTPSRGNRLSA